MKSDARDISISGPGRDQPAVMTAKLAPPPASPYQVARQQICERAAASSRVVLVRAPAGFGKTTVMLQLRDMVRQRGSLTSWLTLDEADNDVSRFLSFLSQAIDGLQRRTVEMPERGGPDTGDLALAILDRVAAQTGAFVIFLDDFETIHNPVVLGLVSRVIESLPPEGRIVIASRKVPDIGLGQMRAKSYLEEIDPAVLRFSLDEVGDYLTVRRRLVLSPGQVQRLHRSTEGWIAAIWLASVALERRTNVDAFIASFSGSNAAVAEYLAEDVLAGLPEALREFLVKSSILNELSAPLCDAVLGCTGSREILQQLERSNLFLIPRDEERNWYRYHGLFAEFLRNQLNRHYPEAEIGELQLAAARWYVENGRPIPAITHALASGDPSFGLELLKQHAEELLGQGRLRLLSRWMDPLPSSALDAAPMLRVVHAWAIAFTRGAREALSMVDGLRESQLDRESAARLRALRPMLLAMLERLEEANELANSMLPLIPREPSFAYGMLALALTHANQKLGRFAELHQFADEARRSLSRSSSHFNISLAESAEATVDLMQGRLKQATMRFRSAASASTGDPVQHRSGSTVLGLLLAEALYEADELDQAQRLLEVHVPMVTELNLPTELISGYVLLSRIVVERGDRERGLELLTQLEAIGHRSGFPRVVASGRLERSRLAVLQRDFAAAGEWLSRAQDPAAWTQSEKWWLVSNDTLTPGICRLRWLVRSGAVSRALDLAKQELDDALSAQRHRRVLKLRILTAEALYRDGQQKLAMRALSKALQFSSGEGFVRPYLEEGETVRALLQEFAVAYPGDAGSGSPHLQEHLNRLLQSERQPVSAPTPQGSQLEPLTRKEQEVLELLAQGHSNNDMAGKLFVSEATVRTHLRSINVKLQAGNRTQAIAIARRLKLIP